VTASEFAFLALGVVLGVATGAALIEVIRARPPGRREIRVTVAPNSIPARRASTLSDANPGDPTSGPAERGPGDRRWTDREEPGAADPEHTVGEPVAPRPNRTNVPDPPIATPRDDGWLRLRPLAPAPAIGAAVGASIAIPISSEPDPQMDAIRAAAVRRTLAAASAGGGGGGGGGGRRPTAGKAGTDPSPAGGASSDPSTGARDEAPAALGAMAPAPAPPPEMGASSPAENDPCAEQRRVAEERCAVAARAREGATEAHEALRAAQHSYDDHVAEAERNAATADPRAVREAKEAAQLAFREARASATRRDEVEAAARDWLTQINDINQRTREAAASAERGRAAAATLAIDLERLSVEADAARISAESAEEACLAAREAVAACQEAASIEAAGAKARAAAAVPAPRPPAPVYAQLEPDDAAMASRAGEDAAIIRLLRGDREALGRIVAHLAGDDQAERRRWQAAIGGLLEAIVGRSIEAVAFDFPEQHPFWGLFTRTQCRDIAAALASLGYRFDGFGDWADDRVPSQRDLSLATGYAGLDPMRIRHWPNEAEMRDLLREVTVAADEYVWEAAAGLTLGELVSLLGRRADGLTELWNDWGRVRPLLLSAD
jgi:hypothetical protein